MGRRTPRRDLPSCLPPTRSAPEGRGVEGSADGDEVSWNRASEKSDRVAEQRCCHPEQCEGPWFLPAARVLPLLAHTRAPAPLGMTLRDGEIHSRLSFQSMPEFCDVALPV